MRILNTIDHEVLEQSRSDGELIGSILDARIAISSRCMIRNSDGMITRFLIVIPEIGSRCTSGNGYLGNDTIPCKGTVELLIYSR